MTILLAAGISFFATWLSGRFFVSFLHKLKYGQTILEVGPTWHKNKQGTPTMGGVMFILGIAVAIIFTLPSLKANSQLTKIFLGLAMALGFGFIGFLDDYLKVAKKRNLGLTSKQKFLLQFALAEAYLFGVQFFARVAWQESAALLKVPFFGAINLGIFYYLVYAVLIVGMVNAVNLTDGIDGLSSSVTFFAAIFLMAICALLHAPGAGLLSATMAGGCLGFLMWNAHPAKIFMGDTGSLFLGGLLCAVLFAIDLPVLLPIVGVVYILEMFSVIIQVFYFKATHGKRIFKMTPLHHHFEMLGWSEWKICIVASLCTIVGGTLAFALVRFRFIA